MLDDKSIVGGFDTRRQLRAQLLATIQEAPTKVVRVLQAPARDLLYLLQNFANKLNA